ncbi:MAG: xanthine dehydrogenase family protein subunit M, partial [Proteobacteria bacterium]|nr:xanthine dehydrogenase family protein subunit M [Pseudomonadota bacterium]
HGDNARALAGGTDLLVQMKGGRRRQGVVIDIKKIPELNAVKYDPVKGLTLGAGVACYKIYGDDAVRAHYPGLIDAVEIIGGTPIQGRATVGGNLCNAAPSADAIPALIAHGAICHIVGPQGVRHVPVEAFCTAPGKNVLGASEILVALHLPPPAPHSGAAYLRFIPRNEMDIAVVGVGASVEVSDGKFRAVRVALASVAPIPLFVTEAGQALEGKPANAESIQIAADLAKAAAKPISDMRGTAEYRSHLCEVMTRRTLQTALDRALGR